jgi:hypothetical protein
MHYKNILFILILVIVIIWFTSLEISAGINDVTTEEKIQFEEETVPLEKLLENLKKRSKEKGIEIYYFEKTIIKEKPKEEYLEHLLTELKSSLKKGKKVGKIRRVEGNLVEIDKGSIHQVRERDIYKIYDVTTKKYKGKVEIQAVADAISIGQVYSMKLSSINVNDVVKFIGQRKYLEIGVLYGIEGTGGGIISRINVFKGWGFEYLLGPLFKSFGRDYYLYLHPIGIRKYFNYPSLLSPYISAGLSICQIGVLGKKQVFVPYSVVGVQLFSGKTIHIDIEARIFFGPDEPKMTRFLAYLSSVSMSW